ncbi:MAG: Potassium channel [Piccolia ochrophora]|nr:MAG: Potassium channel [Piccolia ochrophora]
MSATPSPDEKHDRCAEHPKKRGTGEKRSGQQHGPAQDGKRVRRFRMRPDDDDEEQDWWFASTAIPLLAATTGPLANMLSIAALVTSWRNNIPEDGEGSDADSVGFGDPRWCIALNVASLVSGFVGNFFLLLNFTRRVRYIVALPMTIVLWYIATTILISITAAMNQYVPPIRPQQTYSQGFWYAIIAAVLYLFSSMILMVNMLGYFLGHYPQHFTLTDHQRTLILQTMIFFIWLAGGGGVFAKVCGWSYVDALYFCDVTIITVGFGDYAAPNDVGKGLVFPFSVGGIIMLGLMVGSINKFSTELSQDKVIKRHVEKQRVRTVDRSVSRSIDLPRENGVREDHSKISAPLSPRERTIRIDERQTTGAPCTKGDGEHENKLVKRLTNSRVAKQTRRARKPRLILLREEKDRFDCMREIQRRTRLFKKWYNLSISLTAFGILWCVGAVAFWCAEQREQGLSYFQALYFCYVSLLTIGYGDLSPRSNAGKPFFVVWSLIAVPTMTILISDMSDTVIASFKRGTFRLADFTVLPKAGLWRPVLDKNPWLFLWLDRKLNKHQADKRVEEGFQVGPLDDPPKPTLEDLEKGDFDEHELARRLALAIRCAANHLAEDPPKRYCYEEWVEYTRLIRFSRVSAQELEGEEDAKGLIEWDWIGEDSPMMAEQSEAAWVLDRLCESLSRYMAKQATSGKARESGEEKGGKG